jgi:hypothetical protein
MTLDQLGFLYKSSQEVYQQSWSAYSGHSLV